MAASDIFYHSGPPNRENVQKQQKRQTPFNTKVSGNRKNYKIPRIRKVSRNRKTTKSFVSKKRFGQGAPNDLSDV